MSIRNRRFKASLTAAGSHLLVSALVAVPVGVLVFGIWFPHPLAYLVAGVPLFSVLIGVHLICGPLLTLVLFNPRKKRAELVSDLALVVFVQLSALAYGMHSISLARPVVVAHEVDRFVVVSRSEVVESELGRAPAEIQSLSLLSGPRWLGTRQAKDGADSLESIEASMRGFEPSSRPSWWERYDDSRSLIKQRMQPLSSLMDKHPGKRQDIERAARQANLPVADAFYLPLVSQKHLEAWSAVLDARGDVVGYVEVSGF